MPAYVLAILNVTDPDGYEPYKIPAAAAVARYGGVYVARGGQTRLLEGDLDPNRVAILRFDSVDQALAWYHSPEYQEALPHRQANSTGSLLLVEGLEVD